MQKLIYPLLLLASLASHLVIPQSANAQNADLFSKDNLNTLSPPNPHKPMGLCAGILMDVLEDPRYESLVNDLLKAVNDYGIGELMVMGRPQTLIAVPDFPKLEQTVDHARLDRLRKQLLRFKAKGLKISFMGGEPRLPRNFFEVYPEAQFVNNGFLWKYLESRTTEIFEHIPEVDTFEAYLWETELLNDRDFFRELRWSGPDPAPILGPTQYYSPADYRTQTIAALSRGARAAGKEFRLLTFAHYRWQENLLIEAFVFGFNKDLVDLHPEVYVTAYPAPFRKKILMLK